MYPVSAQFLNAVRHPHTLWTNCTHFDPVTSVTTVLSVLDGTITDDATSQTRRSLRMTMPPQAATWEALDTVGGEITVTQTMRYVDGATEDVPMGVFVVDVDDLGYGPGDTLTITTAPDRMGKVLKNTLPPSQRASMPGNAAWQEVKRLVEGAWSTGYPFPGWSSIDETATTPVGALLWADGNRGTAIQDICTANAIEVLFDRNGLGVIRKVPVFTNTSTPAYQVVAGVGGVVLAADRSRDRTAVRNAIIVSTTATDVTFPPVEVKNTTTGDPLSVTGPLGYMAEDYSLSTLRNSAQAQAAGRVELSRLLGVAKQLSLTAVGNPALDSYDVVSVVLPKTDANIARPSELHVLDVVSHPLAPSGTQALTTRATVADQSHT